MKWLVLAVNQFYRKQYCQYQLLSSNEFSSITVSMLQSSVVKLDQFMYKQRQHCHFSSKFNSVLIQWVNVLFSVLFLVIYSTGQSLKTLKMKTKAASNIKQHIVKYFILKLMVKV